VDKLWMNCRNRLVLITKFCRYLLGLTRRLSMGVVRLGLFHANDPRYGSGNDGNAKEA